jgi:Ser/Thr protein kinase RdoA (MazF antagonist)
MSTPDDRDLASRIARHCYGREPRLEPLARYNNLVFRLRFADGAKILKLAKDADGAAIRKELRLIDLVRGHGVPAPTVEHADGQAALVGRPFFIMASAGEHTVANWIGAPSPQGPALFAEMGAVLAGIHAITLPASGDIRHDGIVVPDPQADRQRLEGVAAWAHAQGFLEAGEVARFLGLDVPPLDGRTLCHRDFHPVQCVVDEGRITAVVDWQSAWAGNAAVDVAIVHAYLDAYCPSELIGDFFRGYTALRPLPPDYAAAYRPVRMAQALALLRVWHGQGRSRLVRHALALYQAYARAV